MKKIATLIAVGSLFTISHSAFALTQPNDRSLVFWENLQKHCGKAYAGALPEGVTDEQFGGKALVMHVKSCSADEIKIPFFVGDDRSRTWILSKDEQNIITLQHDHRHEDGSEEEVNFYGGKSTNIGHENFQFFPANPHTATIIPDASSNVWWIDLTDDQFVYNLKRIRSERGPFRVEFDLTTPIDTPEDPWGWEE